MDLTNRVKHLKPSPIRNISRRCAEVQGINLGQGVCDLPIDPDVKRKAIEAIENNKNIYSPHQGITTLRCMVKQKLLDFNRIPLESEDQIMISHGSTGAFVSAIQALLNPGDEVIMFQPFYGFHLHLLNYFQINTITHDINLEDYSIDLEAVEKSITSNTKIILLCTPNNPTGKVFTKAELSALGDMAIKHNLVIFSDEIYEYVTYPGHEHYSLASDPKYFNHVVTFSGFSKTYHMTGWRLGYAAGPKEVIMQMALVHDLFYICPVTPLQYGVMEALEKPQSYYTEMRDDYLMKRNYVISELRQMGFYVTAPQGTYYLLIDIKDIVGKIKGAKNGADFITMLLEHAHVAGIPGEEFYKERHKGQHLIRFCFAKRFEELENAMKAIKAYLG